MTNKNHDELISRLKYKIITDSKLLFENYLNDESLESIKELVKLISETHSQKDRDEKVNFFISKEKIMGKDFTNNIFCGVYDLVDYMIEYYSQKIKGIIDEIELDENKKNSAYEKIEKVDNKFKEAFNLYHDILLLKINVLHDKLELSQSINSHFNGKKAKGVKNKEHKEKALKYATQRWAENNDIPREEMATEIKNKLNLRTTIRSISNWIKSADPYVTQGKKRKRKPL